MKTTVLPATSAGAIFQTGMATGKFHGVMQATTPCGWFMRVGEVARQLRLNRLAVHAAGLARAEFERR